MLMLADLTQWVGLGGGMLLLIWVVFRRRMSGVDGSARSSSTSPIFRSSLAGPIRIPSDPTVSLMDAPSSTIRWEVGMHEVARDLRAELDSKMGAVNSLIAQAREESARLAQLIERAERLGIAPVRDTLQAIEQLGSDDREEVVRAANGLAAMAERAPHANLLSPPFVEQIYELADEGRPAKEIAQRLRAPLGDVEFALGLRTPSAPPSPQG